MRLGKAHLRWHTYYALKAEYDYRFPTPALNGYANNEGNGFSFGLRAHIQTYMNMHAISGDNNWLDLAFASADHIQDNTDARRQEKGEILITPLVEPWTTYDEGNYYQAPYPYITDGTPVPGWGSNDGSIAGHLRVQILQDGQVLGVLAQICDYVLSNSITAYEAQANSLLASLKDCLDMHLASWLEDSVLDDVDLGDGIVHPSFTVQGSFYYPNRFWPLGGTQRKPLAYNHSGGWFTAALIYDKYIGNAVYVAMADKHMDYIRDARLQGATEGTYYWQYRLGDAGAEDINHGSYYLTPFLLFAYKNGYCSITTAEITAYADTIASCWQEGVGNVSERVDGEGTIPGGEAFNVGELTELGEFNADIYTMARDLLGTSYVAAYFSMYSGYSALLRYTPEAIR